ncbi:MAG: inositol-3-phosphate synthase, partial [Calditrichia bacterium]|nr:inositol-3-phosphate synthase [Calditrichia bacterium]
MMQKLDITPAKGKLGILTPGMGAVSTTFIAGVFAILKGIAKPIGSVSQMGTIRLGKRTDKRVPMIKDFVPLTGIEDLVFGGWDIFEENAYQSALTAGVLEKELLDKIRPELESVKPMKGVFDKKYVKKLDGTYIKSGKSKWDLAQMLIEDMQKFKDENSCDRLVIVWCGSTEIFIKEGPVHQSLEAFEKGLKSNDPEIAPSMIYAYAAIKLGIPYANGAPNLSQDFPALYNLAKKTKTPLSGKDFKTGQTLMKTILAPGFKARLIGLNGWFSTNILGNRDGEVLDDPESFKTKEESKLSVLDQILQPDVYPELYKNFYHKVRINYYPPRGDNKEGWDNID